MLKHTEHMLIIIPFDLPWVHTADYTHQTAKELAKKHIVICYMQKDAQSIKEFLFHRSHPLLWKKYVTNIYLYFPLYILPFRRFKCIENLNNQINIMIMKLFVSRAFHRQVFYKKVLWIFYPEYVWMIRFFQFVTIYDCVDYHIGQSPTAERRDIVKKWETELIEKCTHFFVNSRVLFELHKNKNKSITLVPQGFRADMFRQFHQNFHSSSWDNKPVIGYVGGINYRLDYSLLLSLIRRTPEYSYVFTGPVQNNDEEYFEAYVKGNILDLFSLPNVYHIDILSKEEIPGIISQFNICMIPYRVDFDINKYCYPMKLFEYFYMGKPVIATDIEELKRFPSFVKIGVTEPDWEKHIKTTLSQPWPKSYQYEQKKLSLKNSWSRKIRIVISVIGL